MKSTMKQVTIITVAAVLVIGATASAGMITPVGADAYVPVSDGTRHIDRTWDGSGLSGGGADWSLDADAPAHAGPGPDYNNFWETSYTDPPFDDARTRENHWAVWDLGDSFTLEGMRVWNQDWEAWGPGTHDQTLTVDVLVSSLDSPGNPNDNPANWTKIGDDVDVAATGDIGIYAALTSTANVRYVAFNDLVARKSAWAGTPSWYTSATDTYFVQLQEIRFFGGTTHGMAWNPDPASGVTNVDPAELSLSWEGAIEPGTFTYDVYLKSPSDPDLVLVSIDQSGTSYTPPAELAKGQYRWRVDTRQGGSVVATGVVWTFTTLPDIFTVVTNSGSSFSKTITLPEFTSNTQLLAKLHVIPKGDGWDRNGRVYLQTPNGDVDLVKLITGFGGETWHTVDITRLRPLLTGTVTIRGEISHYTGDWGMDFSIEAIPGGNPAAPTVWAQAMVPSGTWWGYPSTRTETVTLPEGLNRIDLIYYVTGHGGSDGVGCCEFAPRTHRIWVDGALVFDTEPWRNASDALRSVNPNSGRWDGNGDGDTTDPYPIDTWSSDFARSNWLPGDDVTPFVIDVTDAFDPLLTTHTIEYETTGDFSPDGGFTVSSFLSATDICDPPLAGDTNHDCIVDMDDLMQMAFDWLMCTRTNGDCP